MKDVIDSLVENKLVLEVTKECGLKADKYKEKYGDLSLDKFKDNYQESKTASHYNAE